MSSPTNSGEKYQAKNQKNKWQKKRKVLGEASEHLKMEDLDKTIHQEVREEAECIIIEKIEDLKSKSYSSKIWMET